MAIAVSSVADTCRAAKRAARALAQVDTAVKDAALEAIAAALEDRLDEILAANERDMQLAREADMDAALLDRLRLDEARVAQVARAVRQIAALADPVGEVIDGHRLPNGLDVRKVRVPLGVVAVVYEARPNVTIDAAALCLKSGNAIVLRGSSSAMHSNAALARIAADAAVAVGLPDGCVSIVAGGGRDELAELATQKGSVDLIIPRGGEGLKDALQAVATVPVIYAASGNCHVYVDADADLDRAQAIVINAKTQRPGVCNAAETLLIHERAAAEFVPRVLRALAASGVQIRADARTRALAGPLWGADGPHASPGDDDGRIGHAYDGSGAGEPGHDAIARHGAIPNLNIQDATEEDWATEYLAPIIAVGIVDSVERAIEHIGRYGSGHSEAIVTRNTDAARAFQLGVDAACVYVNASTRFTDGGEFGMGAEIGNSTQKLHARGPIGLRELCTFKYLIEGDGHVRD
jgi:glutamate-5-semialdehyde dehydrogenase